MPPGLPPSRIRLTIGSALALLLAAGCAGIRVRRAEGPTVTGAWRASAISAAEVSPRSRQTIRRLDLDTLYPDRLTELASRLHEEAVRDPRAELLFTLAEINFLRGTRAEKHHSPEACAHYYLAAGYAYHYLFGDEAESRTAVEAFDPRFRLACDLYNAGLAKCIAAAQRAGQLDPRHRLVLPGREGKDAITLRVVHRGFRYGPEEFGPVQPCSDYQVVGLQNHHRTYGLGVPLVASRDPKVSLPGKAYYPSNLSFPATAFFRFEGSLADLHEHRAGRLELYNPLTIQSVKVGSRRVPLESDLTTPLAYYLAGAGLDTAGYTGFLRPDWLGPRAGLHTLEPYEPGRIPVVLVHGLLGTPTTWAPLFNDLQADPVLRRRYQFWVYFYPTGNPFLLTASDLRRELGRMRKVLDPEGKDAALADMVLVGHSMGGLVARLLTIDGGDDFWRLVSGTPLEKLSIEPTHRAELRNTFYFERQPFVRRAIFLATPHRGSRISPSLLGRLGARLAGLPDELLEISKDVLEDNPDVAESFRGSRVTSIDLLAPDAPALQLISHRERPAGVRYHSIIGVTPRNVLLVERLFGGGYCQPSDGVVPLASADLEGVESRQIVDADHYRVHHHPLAILEVRRILLEHLREHDAQNQTIQRAGP